jgi:hypothetical protein
MAGVDLRTVQELAGHKTISMTVRYAHLAPEHNQAAIEKLDRKPAKTDAPLGRQRTRSKRDDTIRPAAQDDPHGNSVSNQMLE